MSQDLQDQVPNASDLTEIKDWVCPGKIFPSSALTSDKARAWLSLSDGDFIPFKTLGLLTCGNVFGQHYVYVFTGLWGRLILEENLLENYRV